MDLGLLGVLCALVDLELLTMRPSLSLSRGQVGARHMRKALKDFPALLVTTENSINQHFESSRLYARELG